VPENDKSSQSQLFSISEQNLVPSNYNTGHTRDNNFSGLVQFDMYSS